MLNHLKRSILAVLLLSVLPLAALAAEVDLQLNISPSSTVTGGNVGGSGASGVSSNLQNNILTAPQTGLISGWTSPDSFVEAIVGNQIAATASAAADGSFHLRPAIFGEVRLRTTDAFGSQAELDRTIALKSGAAAPVTNVIMPPTLNLITSAFEGNGTIAARGRAIPGSDVSVTLTDAKKVQRTYLFTVSGQGQFALAESAQGLAFGPLTILASISFAGQTASVTYAATIKAGPVTPQPRPVCRAGSADLNCDGRVNLQDISILLANFGVPKPSRQYDLNQDGKIDLIDFSILLYHYAK